MSDVREFMTGPFVEDEYSGRPINDVTMMAWSERHKARLMGGARGKHYVPKFRPFDMLERPNQSLVIFQNSDQRIGVESIVGCQSQFTRGIDFNVIYFQFCGETEVETEFGIYTMKPGTLMRIPDGISHRSIGTPDSLRLYAWLHAPVIRMFEDDQHLSETEFHVERAGGPNWDIPADAQNAPKGVVTEQMITWRDTSPEDYTRIERHYEDLVGASSIYRDQKTSGIGLIRAFDLFKEITGRRGPGPRLVESPYFMIEVYNTTDEQFAFHRALRTEEFGLQFSGAATNMSEFEDALPMKPGDLSLLPLGISHSVICEENFLRTVWYSSIPWDVMVNPNSHAYESTFSTTANVIKPAPWQQAAE